MSVSVVIPAYNVQDSIRRALLSALNQTAPPSEIIVVDDCSSDRTRAQVKALARQHPQIRLIENESNRGPSASRNAAIRAATGVWVAVLDADDAWAPDRLAVLMQTAEQHVADVVADNQFFYDAVDDAITRIGFPPERGTRWIAPVDAFEQEIKLGAEFSFGILKPVIRRDFLLQHQLRYDEALRYGEDLLFLAEMLINGARTVLVPQPLYIYTTRVGDWSGMPSPHSRSLPRFDLFSSAVDALCTRYAHAMPPHLKCAMSRMARRFRLEHHANRARSARRERGLLAYGLHVARRPVLLIEAIARRALQVRIYRPDAHLRPEA